MQDIPIKAAVTTAVTLASGAVSMINEDTLIPLGIFVAFATALVVAAWKLSSAVTRAADKLDAMDNRISAIERIVKDTNANQ